MADEPYDVIIIGAGPAGIFAALTLTGSGRRPSVLILDKGPDIDRRNCPRGSSSTEEAASRPCLKCRPCALTCGWGGAGAFSDGKLTLTSKFGGNLHEYIGEEATLDLIAEIDRTYVDFGAADRVYGSDDSRNHEIAREAAKAGLGFVAAKIRHLGTENCKPILAAMRRHLSGLAEVRTGVAVASVIEDTSAEGQIVRGVRTESGEEFRGRYVIAAPGREGSEWFRSEAKRLGLSLAANPVDIGVRIEVPAVVLDHITDSVYESKLTYFSKSFDDPVRTFCMCPRGEVVIESSADLTTVNGHSYSHRKTENTNFAVLVSKTFTEPFKEPIAYGKYIASLANMLGGGVIVQRLGDLMSGRRSTEKRIAKGMVKPTLREATPGDLSLVLPYRYLIDILEMLQAMEGMAPGVSSASVLLYGVEVKFYSSRVKVKRTLETGVRNLFVAGDGAGITRGLAQASASGVYVAREILKREGLI